MTEQYDENDLIYSPLQQTYTEGAYSVEIQIYRMPDRGWTLEVVDQDNTSTVWDHEFETDAAALEQALAEIKADGLKAFIGKDPEATLH